jgi:uncharacterized protein
VGVVVILILTVLTGCSAATDNKPVVNVGSQQTGLWVSGEGKVTIVPDLALVTLGVSAKTATVGESQALAATAMDKVIAALKAAGVAEKDIQTQNFSIYQDTRWDDIKQQDNVIGYNVSNTIVAKLREISKVGQTIDAVVEAGGNYIRFNSIQFSVDEPSDYFVQARELAMQKAKAKAEQMAKLSGVTLGDPTYVTESTNNYPMPYVTNYYREDMAMGAVAPTTSISAGEMEITATVQIAYEIK